MTTIDKNGAKHDNLGRYAEQHQTAAPWDLTALGGDLNPPTTEGESDLKDFKKEDFYRIGAGVAVAAVAVTGIAGCARGNDTTPPDPGPSVTAPPESAAPTPPVEQETPAPDDDTDAPVDVAALENGHTVPAGQIEEARAAGRSVFELADGTGVVFDLDSRLPDPILADLARHNGRGTIDAANDMSQARGGGHNRGVALARLRVPGAESDTYIFRSMAHVDYMPWEAGDSSPITAQDAGFATHAEAVAFIQPWLTDGIHFYDLTQ